MTVAPPKGTPLLWRELPDAVFVVLEDVAEDPEGPVPEVIMLPLPNMRCNSA
jgi:hypothetical protein